MQLQLPDGRVMPLRNATVEYDMTKTGENEFFQTLRPLESGWIEWEHVEPHSASSWRCHFASIERTETVIMPRYDASAVCLEERSLP